MTRSSVPQTSADISIDQVDGQLAQAMLDDSPDCIKLLDQEGRLFFMSSNGMTAMDIDQFSMVENQFWWDLWPAKHKKTLVDAVAAANRGVSVSFEADCPTAKGRLRDWRVRVTQIQGGLHHERLLAISEDITDRLRIRRVKNKLASENEALNRFSHLLVHDLRNPLRHISMLTELLQRKVEKLDDAESEKGLNKLSKQINSASHNLLHMIGGLQSLSSQSLTEFDSGELETGLTLMDYLSEAEQLVGSKLLVVETDSEIGNYRLIGNRGLLISLFLNLLENSLKYRRSDNKSESADSIVRVKVHIAKKDKELLQINVSDNGPGFPDDERSEALKPLGRLSNSKGVDGSGMGLSLVDRICRSHGGWVEVVAKDKQHDSAYSGANVLLALPYARVS